MKYLILILVSSTAFANPYQQRLRQVEAAESQAAYANAAQMEDGARRVLYNTMVRMASRHGGLTDYGIKLAYSGGMMLPSGQSYFSTASNLVCDAIYSGTDCRDNTCSNAAFHVVNCINASGTWVKMDRSGKLYPWPSSIYFQRDFRRGKKGR